MLKHASIFGILFLSAVSLLPNFARAEEAAQSTQAWSEIAKAHPWIFEIGTGYEKIGSFGIDYTLSPSWEIGGNFALSWSRNSQDNPDLTSTNKGYSIELNVFYTRPLTSILHLRFGLGESASYSTNGSSNSGYYNTASFTTKASLLGLGVNWDRFELTTEILPVSYSISKPSGNYASNSTNKSWSARLQSPVTSVNLRFRF